VNVLVVCARQYNGHELWTALGILQEQGHTFEVISTDYYIQDEVTFKPNVIERIIPEVDADELGEKFDGLMIVSGNMADTEAYWDDPKVQSYVTRAGELDLPTAAICCSVPTIASIAEGKRVSFFPLVRSKIRLRDAGAILTTVAMTVDGKLVTAEHQMASQIWAEAFSDVLHGREYRGVELQDSGYTPKGQERKPIPGMVQADAALQKMTDFYITSGMQIEDPNAFLERSRVVGPVMVHDHEHDEECNPRCYEWTR
jgi:putative intracellular protease/amidase